MTSTPQPDACNYAERRSSRSTWINVRGVRYHLNCWGDASLVSEHTPALFMLHGWMDVGASFQFLVDALQADRFVIAPDWRGFGLSNGGSSADSSFPLPRVDTYWFPDYLADLDVLLSAVFEGDERGALPADILGHSMGGNVAMLYAGVRPERVRRVVNLEGFGLPDSDPEQAPDVLRRWLDELREPATLRSYASLESVAKLLQRNDPLLRLDRARWLASHWASETPAGVWNLRANPAHKHANPVLYRKAEALACWRRLQAPMLWLDGDRTDTARWWGDRYSRAEFDQRISAVKHVERHTLSPSGHMLHHDTPEQAASLIDEFLSRSASAFG